MLTDAALKYLKPKAKMYKVTDRDGMYVRVAPSGGISFRLDYRLNGRRETVHLGKYARDGISLARARELCIDARRAIAEGRSPAIEKQREKRRIKEAKSFGEFGEKWLTASAMADSTRAMRRSIFERELRPVWRNRLLSEITPDDLRALCAKIVERGAPATAIHVRDILKQIYGYAILHGEKIANPAADVGPASIATFAPKDRALTPTEIRIMLKQLENVATLPTIRLGMKLYLLTMVRKSELQDAVWDEVDFENAVWTIPKERMKRSKPHNVYLCRQTLDIMIALKTCAGNSRYLLPSRYDADAPMSRATFNRVTYAVVEQAKKQGLPLAPFTVHDLRRTGSTLLNEMGFNRDWIEKCLAHEDGRSSRGVVIFSGGTDWQDHELLWQALDETRTRIPSMVLATTAQHKGCDQIAHAWAAARGVKTVRFTLNRALGKRAGFVRNEQLLNLKPVHAVVCEGSGIQSNLLSRVREANVPYHAFAIRHQRVAV